MSENTLTQIKDRRKNYLISFTNNTMVFSGTLNSLVKIKFSESVSPASNCHSIEIENFAHLTEILTALDFYNSVEIMRYFYDKFQNSVLKDKKYLTISYLNLDNFQFGC